VDLGKESYINDTKGKDRGQLQNEAGQKNLTDALDLAQISDQTNAGKEHT